MDGYHPNQHHSLTNPPYSVALGLFLSMLDSSIVATSLFTIAVEFNDVDSINWVALAYTLTYLSCAVLFARVSDVVGRRTAFTAGYVIFIVFSLACGFSRSMQQLIAFRALQGLGGSGEFSFLGARMEREGGKGVLTVPRSLQCVDDHTAGTYAGP